MPDPLKLASLMAQAIAALPNPGSPSWQREMERIIARGHTAAWIAGQAERLGVKPDSPLISQARLSRAERAEIKGIVEAQLRYFRGFQGDLAGMSEAQIKARALLYAGATRQSLYAARWGDWDIPQGLMPGNQDCKARCLCVLSIKDNGDGTGVLTRAMSGTEHHCASCPPLQGDHPVRRRGYIETKHMRGAHDQRSHGRSSARRRAYQAAYREARAGGDDPSSARAYAREQGLLAQGARDQRLARMQLKGSTPVPLNARGVDPTALPVRRFNNDDAAHAALKQKLSLSADEQQSLNWYAGVGHETVNGALRGHRQGDSWAVDRATGNIDTVMHRARTTGNVEVYRGMLVTDSHGQAFLDRMQVGATYRDSGYLSTTASANYARQFGYDGRGQDGATAVSVRVRVPAGTPAIYMPSARPNSPFNEYELLLGRGLNYRVVGRSEKEGHVTLEVEVIP